MFLFSVIAGLAIAFIIFNTLQPAFIRWLIVPPATWKRLIEQAQKRESRMVSLNQIGSKVGALRRRIIIGCSQPSDYSTVDFEGIRISQADGNSRFVENCKGKYPDDPQRRILYGFLHPNCDAGGGGERVLWEAVQATLLHSPRNVVVIYSGGTAGSEEILSGVSQRFEIEVDATRIVFIRVSKSSWIDPSSWPRFTLLGQAIGSIVLAFEALGNLPPDVFVDTMGLPFCYPAVSGLFQLPVISYVHYPVISEDMLNKLQLKDFAKYCYWKILIMFYAFAGWFADIALANSSWTLAHIRKIWWLNSDLRVLYPPVDVDRMLDMKAQHEKEKLIVYVAQFRPEKRHRLVLDEFCSFAEQSARDYKLVFIGSARGEEDRKMAESIANSAKKLDIENRVEIIVDAKYETMLEYLAKSEIGINAMWNEHFGIAVVEYLASGAIPVCHASAGPLLDICRPWNLEKGEESDNALDNTGFFFTANDDLDQHGKRSYPTLSEALCTAVESQSKDEIRKRGENLVVTKFSSRSFQKGWFECLKQAEALEFYKRNNRPEVEKLY